MKKTIYFLSIITIAILLFAGCSSKEVSYQDGLYKAEFADFDTHGYKDTLALTVKDGSIVSVNYDGVNKDGGLKTKDEKLKQETEAVQGTYPEKIAADLANHYMELQDISKIDVVAGATYSSESFKALYTALQPNMISGDTSVLVIENVPEK